MRIKEAWDIIQKVNSGEIDLEDMSDKEIDELMKAVVRLTRRYVFLNRIWMMRDVIKAIAIILIVLLGIDIIIDLVNLFK